MAFLTTAAVYYNNNYAQFLAKGPWIYTAFPFYCYVFGLILSLGKNRIFTQGSIIIIVGIFLILPMLRLLSSKAQGCKDF